MPLKPKIWKAVKKQYPTYSKARQLKIAWAIQRKQKKKR